MQITDKNEYFKKFCFNTLNERLNNNIIITNVEISIGDSNLSSPKITSYLRKIFVTKRTRKLITLKQAKNTIIFNISNR